jgi:hypothetical protein
MRALLVAVADKGATATQLHVGGELLAQGGLADAGLARDHHQPALA